MKRKKVVVVKDEEDGRSSRPKRRAARNITRGSYIEDEYMESPISDDYDEMGEKVKEKSGRKETKKKLKGRKVPRMKIKMIGRSDDNDSPIFFAQSVDEVSY